MKRTIRLTRVAYPPLASILVAGGALSRNVTDTRRSVSRFSFLMACEKSYRVDPLWICKDRRGRNASVAATHAFLLDRASGAYVMTQSPSSDRFTKTPELICRSSQCGSSSIPSARL